MDSCNHSGSIMRVVLSNSPFVGRSWYGEVMWLVMLQKVVENMFLKLLAMLRKESRNIFLKVLDNATQRI